MSLASLLPIAPKIRPATNIGCLFDIPTGQFIKGIHGEHILNGGNAAINSLQGPGNSFKTEIINYMMYAPAHRMGNVECIAYDTENSMSIERITRSVQNALKSSGIVLDDDKAMANVSLVQSADIYGDVWFDLIKEGAKEALKDKLKKTPLLNDNGKPLEIHKPAYVLIDSLSEFKITDTQERIVDDNAIGDSKTRTVFMSEGLAKTQLISQLPNLAVSTGINFFMVAHTGETIDIGGMFAPKPTKLTHAKSGIKHKGVPQKWTVINNNLYEINNAKVLYNPSTRTSLYPRTADVSKIESVDLNVVNMINIRNKGGPSGFFYELIISQSEGLLPVLTMFHYIKEHDRYGITGNNSRYHLDLYPATTVSRVSIRTDIRNDARLSRAVEITAQLLQMSVLWSHKKLEDKYRCTPEELYNDLKKKGYDWDVLLDTRGWWCFTEDDAKYKPFLSTMDLLAMRLDEYHPYWMPKKG